jgi:hypothetical protein
MAFHSSDNNFKDPLNQNTYVENTRIASQGDYMENELKMSEKFFKQQNNLDEKITNNMLKINVLIYIFILCLTGILVFYSTNIFYIRPYEDQESRGVKLTFSILYFRQEGKEVINTTNPYSCIYNSTSCENNCKNFSLPKLKEIFPLECYMFAKFQSAGIIVSKFKILVVFLKF